MYSFETILKNLTTENINKPQNRKDIPLNVYMVYILTYNNKPIVLGHGKKNRANVICDDKNTITSNHIKALFVRIYNLYGDGNFERFIIKCKNKEEANELEKTLQNELGGNSREIPEEMNNKLFNGLNTNSKEYLLINQAICSSYDGLSDLKNWKKKNLIDMETWDIVSKKLCLIY
jgi:hypothetical protein